MYLGLFCEVFVCVGERGEGVPEGKEDGLEMLPCRTIS